MTGRSPFLAKDWDIKGQGGTKEVAIDVQAGKSRFFDRHAHISHIIYHMFVYTCREQSEKYGEVSAPADCQLYLSSWL